MARDRVYINEAYRAEIDSMKSTNLLGYSMVENKESFLIAVALGLEAPASVKNRDGWFLMKNLKTTDKALLAAVLLGAADDAAEIDQFADIDKAISLCEECAESGFGELQALIEASEGDRDILERRLIKELDARYLQYFS